MKILTPLTPLSNHADDYLSLIPSHFLIENMIELNMLEFKCILYSFEIPPFHYAISMGWGMIEQQHRPLSRNLCISLK